jgi:hypothetical protein
MRILVPFLLMASLVACGENPQPASEIPAAPTPAAVATPDAAPNASAMSSPVVPQAAALPVASAPGVVDYTCRVDADCTVKDVGNCCGYYPACVNKDSPTFPDQVRADCAARGESSICGFAEIRACRCDSGRCLAADAAVQ